MSAPSPLATSAIFSSTGAEAGGSITISPPWHDRTTPVTTCPLERWTTSAAAAIGVASTRKRSAGRIPFGPCERRSGHDHSFRLRRADLVAVLPHSLRSRPCPALVESPEEAEEPVEDGERMRRTTRNVQIDGQERVRAIVDLVMSHVRPARDGAGADGDDDLRRWNRVVRLLQREPHVLGHRAGDEQAVGMPGRSNELDAEAAQIEDGRAEHVDVRLAAVAPARAHHPELQRSTKEPPQVLVESGGPRIVPALEHQVLPAARGQPVLAGEGDRALGTRLHAVGAEQAAAQVELKDRLRGDGSRGARLRASATAVLAARRIEDGEPAETVGERWRPLRKCRGPVSLPRSREQYFQHEHLTSRARSTRD